MSARIFTAKKLLLATAATATLVGATVIATRRSADPVEAPAVSRDAADITPPRVVGVTPVPGSTISNVPNAIIVTFDEPIKASTVNRATFLIKRSGGDGTFNDGNEVALVASAVSMLTPTQARLELAGVKMPDDIYQVTLISTPVAPPPPPPPPPPTSTSSSGTSGTSSSSSSSGSSGSSSGAGGSSGGGGSGGEM